jgi:hypothetical protein
MNNDQIAGYILLNSPYIKFPGKYLFNGVDYKNESYILYSNKKGDFDKVNIKFNYKRIFNKPTITAGLAIVDENDDTFLLLGSEEPGDGIYAFKQDTKTSFTETSSVSAPTIMRADGKTGAYSDVVYGDVDADGTKEVVASIATHNWKGRLYTII